jgi:hypothetical protein
MALPGILMIRDGEGETTLFLLAQDVAPFPGDRFVDSI